VVVRRLRASAGQVDVETSDGTWTGAAVVGADGASGSTARHVGVTYQQVDLGLDAELALSEVDAAAWRSRMAIDWGPVPGAYGWVFPKRDRCSVGVIGPVSQAAALSAYLDLWIRQVGLSHCPQLSRRGHLTKTRAVGAPTHRGRVLVAGDALGAVEPWTREGIFYALASGQQAGQLAAEMVSADLPAVVELGRRYDAWVESWLDREFEAAADLLAFFTRRRSLVHRVVTQIWPGWWAFCKVTRGHWGLYDVVKHRPIRWGLRILGGSR
jgi:flavin-dependent dehydrogenase